MEQIVLHFLIPLVLLRIIGYFMKIDKKIILFLSPIAVLPDIDYFFFHHRATFHNLFAGILIVLIATLVTKWIFKEQKNWKIAFAAAFYFSMHIILDGGGVIFFYPLTTIGYNLLGQRVTIELVVGSLKVGPSFFIFHGVGIALLGGLLLWEVILEERKKKR